MGCDTTETQEQNYKNDIQLLCHLGIIFYEKEETQKQTVVKEFKSKYIFNLTHPVEKMLDYSGGYPEFTDDHKCLLKHHLSESMYEI